MDIYSNKHIVKATKLTILIFIAFFIFLPNQKSFAEDEILFAPSLIVFDKQSYTVPASLLGKYKSWLTWLEVSERVKNDGDINEVYNLMPSPVKAQWNSVIQLYNKQTSKLEKVRLVSGFFNNWLFRSDKFNYGVDEYWASPKEFITHNGGDCEDFAIIKYYSLLNLGWNVEDMWIVAIKDRSRNNKGHAILLIEIDNKHYILDNLSRPANTILEASKYSKLYNPVLAVSDNGLLIFEKPSRNKSN